MTLRPLNVFEEHLTRIAGLFVFWDSASRQAFRQVTLRFLRAVHSKATVSLPAPDGSRILERRVKVLGVSFALARRRRSKIRIALLVDEYFGGWDTPIGGYGALARKYVCKLVPDDTIDICVLLYAHDEDYVEQKTIDGIDIFKIPRSREARQKWLDEQAFELFLTIEMTALSFRIAEEYQSQTPFLFMIQDPRDPEIYQPLLKHEVRLRDDDWAYVGEVKAWVQFMLQRRQISFVSQGQSLTEIARRTYAIPSSVPIKLIHNPVQYAEAAAPTRRKEQSILFLGRLEAQKRAWIFCEIAKLMPQYEFYVLGETGRGRNESANREALRPYRDDTGVSLISNLHFLGHVDGEQKTEHLKSAKVLVNTSIWEGIPVSWLEALSFGTLIVSAFDRDDIVSRFGVYVGEAVGDGTDADTLSRFVRAIESLMTNERLRSALAEAASAYIRDHHRPETFAVAMRAAIRQCVS